MMQLEADRVPSPRTRTAIRCIGVHIDGNRRRSWKLTTFEQRSTDAEFCVARTIHGRGPSLTTANCRLPTQLFLRPNLIWGSDHADSIVALDRMYATEKEANGL